MQVLESDFPTSCSGDLRQGYQVRNLLFFPHLHIEDGGRVPCLESLGRPDEAVWSPAHEELHGVRIHDCLAFFSGLKVSYIVKLVIIKSYIICEKSQQNWVVTAQCPLVCIVPGLRITFHKIQSVRPLPDHILAFFSCVSFCLSFPEKFWHSVMALCQRSQWQLWQL